MIIGIVYIVFYVSHYSIAALQADLINELMMESLKNNHVRACEGERITLHCPRNTHIHLENTFYGRLVPSSELCPSTAAPRIELEDTSCDVVEAHTKLLEQCRNKRKCKIIVEPSYFGRDPCPTTSKYLQISYKCKPISFDDQNFCEGSNMQLNCKQNKRLAIYSAQYGRTANGQAMHCTPNTPIINDCLLDVLGHVLNDCHAQTECTLAVNDKYFGNPCPYGVTKYLSLIFMCVNDEIFSEAAVKGNLISMKKINKELRPNIHDKVIIEDISDVTTSTPSDSFAKKPRLIKETVSNDAAFIPDVYDIKSATKAYIPIEDQVTNVHNKNERNGIGVALDFVRVLDHVKNNKEKAILYAGFGIFIGLLLLLIAFLVVYCTQRRKKKIKRGLKKIEHRKMTEMGSITELNQQNHSSICNNHSQCFDMSDISFNGQSFMRFNPVAPPPTRLPPNLHIYG